MDVRLNIYLTIAFETLSIKRSMDHMYAGIVSK